MLMILMITLILLFLALAEIYRKNQLCKRRERQIEELKKSLDAAKDHTNRSMRQLFDAANTIHLYAALSEEEAGTQELKQKQQEIRKLSETILQMSGG